MLVRMVSGSLSLLAFSAAIIAGLWAGNDITTILIRAWWTLILFLIFGAIIGWMAQIVIDEHIRKMTRQMMDHLQEKAPAISNSNASDAGNVA